MSLSLSQSLSLTQSHSLLLTQKMELSQRLAQKIEGIRGKNSSTDLAVTLKKVITDIIAGLPDNLKMTFAAVCDEQLQAAMLKTIGIFAVPTRAEIRNFVLHHIYTVSTDGQGRFIHFCDLSGGGIVDVPKTDFGTLAQALVDLEKFTQETEMIKKTLEEQVRSGKTVSFEGLHDMQDALKVAPSLIEPLERFTNAMLYLLSRKDAKGIYTLKDFALDCVVLEKLDIILSERLQKRFVKRFKRTRAGSNRHDAEICLLNTIGELTLISLGIISPDIFTPRKGNVDSELLEELNHQIACADMTLIQAFKYYALRTEGTFFWSRYYTLNQPPCRVTEELIRSFITKTVRKDRGAVLRTVRFDEFFGNIVEAALEKDTEEKEIRLREVLISLIEDEKFQEQFVELLKSWHKYLYIFYR